MEDKIRESVKGVMIGGTGIGVENEATRIGTGTRARRDVGT
jgi:hypothetical protein